MEIPYTVKPRPDTGLYNAKLGTWLFLASEVMLFGALFSSYVLLRVGSAEGEWSMGLMNITVGAGNTMVLIASSMFVVLAWAQLKQGNLSGKWISKPFFKSPRNWGYVQWKWATVICAIFFLVVKWSYEWPSKFVHYDVWFKEPSMLHAKVQEGYKGVAGQFENDEKSKYQNLIGLDEDINLDKDNDGISGWDEFITNHSDDDKASKPSSDEVKEFNWTKYYIEKKLYIGRFFKTYTLESQNAFSSAWDKGTLALSGHINGYEEAKINVEVSGWNPDSGVSESEADQVLKRLSDGSAAVTRNEGGVILKNADYKKAKLAEYQLRKSGFNVDLSVTDYQLVEEHPYFWRTGRVNEDIGGKPRVRNIKFALDKSKVDGKYTEIVIDTDTIKRLNSYEPKHSTFFGIYYTITGLHAAHVFGGIIVMIYNLLPIGLATWHRDREQFANRIESFGLFWHFVDLVWIFLFPILYIL